MTEIEEINRIKEKFNDFNDFRDYVKWFVGIEKNTFSSWKNIIKFWKMFNLKFVKRSSEVKTNLESQYFTTKAARYIFALCYLDREIRAELLEMADEIYATKSEAKKWRNKIAREIHSDVCNHLEADKAMIELNKIYKRMIKYVG